MNLRKFLRCIAIMKHMFYNDEKGGGAYERE